MLSSSDGPGFNPFLYLISLSRGTIMLYGGLFDMQHYKEEDPVKTIVIGKELHSLNHLTKRYVETATHKQQIDKITGTNGWIIGYLSQNADKDIYQKNLEEEFSVTRSTASKVLALMEQKGLIERHGVAHDARLKKLVLTEKAWELSKLMREDFRTMEETLTKGFTEEEKENLLQYIQRMKDNISSY
jgi:Transcriptional regulators